jgi:hypothetical protein
MLIQVATGRPPNHGGCHGENDLAFALEADAPATYTRFQAAFARDVPTLDTATLIRACRRSGGQRLTGA